MFHDCSCAHAAAAGTELYILNCAGYFSVLKHVIPEVLPLLLMGSALSSSGSFLESSGIGSEKSLL